MISSAITPWSGRTTNRKPTTELPTYPAASVATAEGDQKSCVYVGIAYGSSRTRGKLRMSPMMCVAPPSFGSMHIETTCPPHSSPTAR